MAKLYGTTGKIICKYVIEKERHGVPMVLKIQWEWGKIIRKYVTHKERHRVPMVLRTHGNGAGKCPLGCPLSFACPAPAPTLQNNLSD